LEGAAKIPIFPSGREGFSLFLLKKRFFFSVPCYSLQKLHFLIELTHVLPSFLADVQRCAVREGYAVGGVQLVEVDLIIADARPDGHHGAYQLAVSA